MQVGSDVTQLPKMQWQWPIADDVFPKPKSHISHFCGSTVRVWSVLWHLAMSVSSSDERPGSLKIVGSVGGMV